MSIISRLWNALKEADQQDSAAKLTLLLLVLYGARYWELQVPTTMLAASGLVLPAFVRSRLFWGAIAILQGMTVIPKMYTIDNHKVLMVYWCTALAVSQGNARSMRNNGRLIVGWCFALASFWKLYTADFSSGSFLHFEILTDPIFASFSRMICGMPSGSQAHNNVLVAKVLEGQFVMAELWSTPASVIVARISSLWTITSELAIAVSFVFCYSLPVLGRYRNVLLMQVIVLTYPIATVIGFGWILAIMGFSQCSEDESNSRASYLAVFGILQLYLIPWGPLVLSGGQSR